MFIKYRYIAIQRCLLGKAFPACFLVGIFCTPIKSLHLKSPFLVIASNSDCTQFHPMSPSRPIDSMQSYANLAPRLLQVCCIILYSMLRLISSDNDIASIVGAMCVSTSPASLAILSRYQLRIIGCAVTLATL